MTEEHVAGPDAAAVGEDATGDDGAWGEPSRGDARTGDADQHDELVDAELERLDDGGRIVGAGPETGTARSEALPFMMSAREHFAAVGDVAITGDARVDAATARLEEIPDLPVADHVAVYDDVHRRLQDALSDADVR